MKKTTKQQLQTQSFFDTSADLWAQQAEGGKTDRVNVISQRHRCVEQVADGMSRLQHFLDIGCGTGKLTLQMASRGIDAIGIDFAEAMIEQCELNKAKFECDNATFVLCSIFDYPRPKKTFDLISAMGLIEYVSPDELSELLKVCKAMLRQGGALAIGSRNRLFNVASLSDYTGRELELGTVPDLLGESLALANARSPEDAIGKARAQNMRHPVVLSHPATKIDVETRHQYTPGELINIVESEGYSAQRIYPVHFHMMPVPALHKHRAAYASIAERVFSSREDDFRFIPQSSSFVLHFERN